jgi:hypothetical protein
MPGEWRPLHLVRAAKLRSYKILVGQAPPL